MRVAQIPKIKLLISCISFRFFFIALQLVNLRACVCVSVCHSFILVFCFGFNAFRLPTAVAVVDIQWMNGWLLASLANN